MDIIQGKEGYYEVENGKIKGYFTEKKRVRGFELVKDAPEDTKKPVRGTEGAAGYDFYAPCDFVVPAKGYSKLIFFNVKVYMPKNEYLGVTIRSSLATTKGNLCVAQGEAIIDSDYYGNPSNDGNIGIMFYNRGEKAHLIEKGTRCCQGIFKNYKTTDDDMPLGKRTGGYGSSGEK